MKKIKFFPIEKNTQLINNYPVPASKKIPDWFKQIQPYFYKNKLSFPMHFKTPNVTV